MFGHTISKFQQGFTLIELSAAIAIIGVLEITTTQFVSLDAVRVASPTANGANQDCAVTLKILGNPDANGVPELLEKKTVAMGDGSVRSISWANSNNETPKFVYAVVTKESAPVSPLVPAVQSCKRNEIFATLSVKDIVDGTTKVVLPSQLLPAVQ